MSIERHLRLVIFGFVTLDRHIATCVFHVH